MRVFRVQYIASNSNETVSSLHNLLVQASHHIRRCRGRRHASLRLRCRHCFLRVPSATSPSRAREQRRMRPADGTPSWNVAQRTSSARLLVASSVRIRLAGNERFECRRPPSRMLRRHSNNDRMIRFTVERERESVRRTWVIE